MVLLVYKNWFAICCVVLVKLFEAVRKSDELLLCWQSIATLHNRIYKHIVGIINRALLSFSKLSQIVLSEVCKFCDFSLL